MKKGSKYKIEIIIFCTVLTCVIIIPAISVQPLTPAEDSYISYEDFSDTNGKEKQILIEYNRYVAFLLFKIDPQMNYLYAYLQLPFISISKDMNFIIYITYDNWDEMKLAWNHRPGWYEEFINFTVKKSNPGIQLDLTPLLNDKERFYSATISIVIVAASEGKAVLSAKENQSEDHPIIQWTPTFININFAIELLIIFLTICNV